MWPVSPSGFIPKWWTSRNGVVVKIDGAVRFDDRVKPSLATALESVRTEAGLGDIYPIKIELGRAPLMSLPSTFRRGQIYTLTDLLELPYQDLVAAWELSAGLFWCLRQDFGGNWRL